MPDSHTIAHTFTPSPNVAYIKESATLAVAAKARALRAAGHAIIDLGAGEPDFATPVFIRRAAQLAIDAGATKYTATEGIAPLREAIAARAREDWHGGGSISAAEVMVTAGSKQALFNACFALFGRGDEVLIPTPSWTSYYEMVSIARATAVPVMGDEQNGLKVNAELLRRAATDNTRGVMLNSPCNPTGAVYSAGELAEILALAAERGWWVISDEIYRHICYDGVAPSVLAVSEERDRLIVIDGVAKAYAMTGWRIGWAIAPVPVIASMTALQSHTTSNAATVSQHAALAALTDREEAERAIANMVREFHARRDAALAVFRAEPALRVLEPHGAFYVFVNVADGSGDAGGRFAERLLEEQKVAVVPGSAFLAPDWIRMSYAATREQVVAGAERIVAAVRALRPARH